MALAPGAAAHDARPLFFQLSEIAPQEFALHWRLPPPWAAHAPHPTLEPNCAPLPGAAWRCRTDPQALQLAFDRAPPAAPILLRLRWRSGQTETRLFAPGAPRLALPPREGAPTVFLSYLGLGLRHMLSGWDHLSMVLLLSWMAQRLWPLLAAITGFTLGHSVTLALGALQLIRLPLAYVECLIALSVVWMAAALHRSGGAPRAHPPLRLFALASAIGLLHGLGFASVLRALGLPQTELPMALFGFNLGVEAGQILFLGVWLALLFGGRFAAQLRWANLRLANLRLANLPQAGAWKERLAWTQLPHRQVPHRQVPHRQVRSWLLTAIGGIAAYWTLARGAALFFA